MEKNYVLTDDEYKEICTLVYDHTGISLTEDKRKLAYSRFSKRLKALNLKTFRDYCHLLRTDGETEMRNFTNAITTNLTSFFREPHHFDRLRDDIVPEWKKKRDRKIRIWSAGCSTGEEPYSLAITLMKNFPEFSNWDVKILATDLDSQVLQTASQGIYPANRLDGLDDNIKNSYFDKSEHATRISYCVQSKLRELITFKQLNLMDQKWPMHGPFDLIICRNVVIYFDKETQIKLFKKFAALQNINDHLIVGHSESLKGITSQYKHVARTSYIRI